MCSFLIILIRTISAEFLMTWKLFKWMIKRKTICCCFCLDCAALPGNGFEKKLQPSTAQTAGSVDFPSEQS